LREWSALFNERLSGNVKRHFPREIELKGRGATRGLVLM
jgi:hypothetical protein